MATSSKLVVWNLLCFMNNKWHSLAAKPLKTLLIDFYSSEDISFAKDLLFLELEGLKMEKEIKVPRRRRDSTSKPGVKASSDIDDILSIFTFLDEKKLLDNIAVFVSTNPDLMPSSRLAEGDLSILLNKVGNLETLCNSLKTDIRAIPSARRLNEAAKFAPSHADHRPIVNAESSNASKSTGATECIDLEYETDQGANLHIQVGDKHCDVSGRVERGVGGAHWGSATSANDLTDTDHDDRFQDFVSRNQKKKERQKRKIASNNTSPSDISQPKKKLDSGLGKSDINYARALQGSNILPPRAAVDKPVKIIGQAKHSVLKAAPRDMSPIAVFCISNVSRDFTESDIREHCYGLSVRVRFVFDITSIRQRAKAFKLAVGLADRSFIEDARSWPDGVVVRPWRPYNQSAVTSAVGAGASVHQSITEDDPANSNIYSSLIMERNCNNSKEDLGAAQAKDAAGEQLIAGEAGSSASLPVHSMDYSDQSVALIDSNKDNSYHEASCAATTVFNADSVASSEASFHASSTESVISNITENING